MAGAIVPTQGSLFTVGIDQTWPYASLWNSPIGDMLSVMFMDLDDGISESVSTQYADTDIIGRAEQVKTWIGNGNREIPLVFKFHAQSPIVSDLGQQLGGSNLTNLPPGSGSQIGSNGVPAKDNTDNVAAVLQAEVVQPALFLDALRFPIIDSSGISHGPPPVILAIGQLLYLRCVVSSCNIRWGVPFDPTTMLPHHAEVSVTFTSTFSVMSNYQFQGPYRLSNQALRGGVDGPANPFSNLGSGVSGTDNTVNVMPS